MSNSTTTSALFIPQYTSVSPSNEVLCTRCFFLPYNYLPSGSTYQAGPTRRALNSCPSRKVHGRMIFRSRVYRANSNVYQAIYVWNTSRRISNSKYLCHGLYNLLIASLPSRSSIQVLARSKARYQKGNRSHLFICLCLISPIWIYLGQVFCHSSVSAFCIWFVWYNVWYHKLATSNQSHSRGGPI